ncbi:MAG: hypothetical protein AAF519_03635 [Bacteroidota bacterium]
MEVKPEAAHPNYGFRGLLQLVIGYCVGRSGSVLSVGCITSGVVGLTEYIKQNTRIRKTVRGYREFFTLLMRESLPLLGGACVFGGFIISRCACTWQFGIARR